MVITFKRPASTRNKSSKTSITVDRATASSRIKNDIGTRQRLKNDNIAAKNMKADYLKYEEEKKKLVK